MNYREYDPAKDCDAMHRIWYEVGWTGTGAKAGLDSYLRCGRNLVAEIDGEVESYVSTAPGTIRYLAEDLPWMCVTGVSTSRIARKQGLAAGLTAAAVAAGAADGALVAGLGIFDQGYYDQFGFGTGSYELYASFDPAHLNVDISPPVPRRLSEDDYKLMHAARLARLRGHGACSITPPEATLGRFGRSERDFGLGYFGPDGRLTHHIWFAPGNIGEGPYNVGWMTYQNRKQFLELMALVKSLGDQIRLVRMAEPPHIQLQDLLNRPFREHAARQKGRFETGIQARGWWQMRILNLEGCLAHTHLPGGEVHFNLRLTDPIEKYLDENEPWRGISGDYVVILGPSSSAEPGTDGSLPMLEATVNAFSRMWLGVRPASGLAISDDLCGPDELLQELDGALLLPTPKPDWAF